MNFDQLFHKLFLWSHLILVLSGCATPAQKDPQPAPQVSPPARPTATARPEPVTTARAEPAAPTPKERSLLFRVSFQQATMHLLGSIHVAKQDIYPLRPEIERAFEQSDVLVLEIALDRQSRLRAQEQTLKTGVYGRGDSLRQHVDPETLALVEKYARENSTLLPLMQLKPWLAATTIMVQELNELGYSPERGLDAHFQRRAEQLRKPTMALETPEQQLSLLSNMEEPVQELMLRETLESLSELEQMMAETFAAWQRGDDKALEEALLGSVSRPEYQPVFERLFLERNRSMVEKLEELLATDQDYFVVVGSGHLVGQGGLLELLSSYGPVQK